MSKVYHFKTIHDLQRLAGMKPSEHPLFAIIKLEDIPELPSGYPASMSYGFYTIGLKRNLKGYITYGRRLYDFQEGVMGFSAPGQVVAYDSDATVGASGWMLFFHAQLLAKHQLAESAFKYGFFDYEVNEALHLSKKEENMIESIFENIAEEYHRPIDKHSRQVVLSNLELLLTYCDRFYSRQFITRNEADSDLLNQFEKEVRKCFNLDTLADVGIPQVTYFAEKLNISAGYLSDLLKTLTGKSTQEHIHFYLIEKAKQKLLAGDKPVSEIAFELGFEYPQYFSRLFKEKTGFSPKEFRN